MKIIHSLIRYLLMVCVFARDIFPYVLLTYLVFFLLENLFVGFVSNNFSLNWVLMAVLVTGFLAVFAPEDTKKEVEKPAGKNDYLLVFVLGLVGGAIIFAKMGGGSLARWATAAVSSMLIVLVGLVSLSDEENISEEEFVEVPSERRSVQKHISWPHVFTIARRTLRPVFLRRVEIPLVYVLIFTLFTAFLIPKNMMLITNSLRRPAPAEIAQTPEPLFDGEPFFWDDANEFVSIRPSQELEISILNGGGDRGAAASFSAILREYGFGRVEIGNADRYDYYDAQIRFRAEDKAQANIIKQLLRLDYPSILEVPSDASKSGIMVILGARSTFEENR